MSSSVIEAVTAVHKVSVDDIGSAPTQNNERSAPLPRPSEVEAADFARVASLPVHEVNAAPPPSESGIAERVARQVDGFVDDMKSLGGNTALQETGSTAGPQSPKPATTIFDGAMDQMKQAYAFAVEANMVSHGSTEATRTFNSLLRGE